MNIKSKENMKLTKEEITNQLVGALEGGSNYWYNLPDLSMVLRKGEGIPLVDRIIETIYKDKTIQIPVFDSEDDDELLGYISYDNLKRADDLINTSGYKWVLNEIKEEDDDANTSDVWFQLVVMGEIVYG